MRVKTILLQILEPSKEVALQLLESGRHNRQTRKLGLDMLRQLSLHEDYVVFLAQDGYYLEALRYVKKHKVNGANPKVCLHDNCLLSQTLGLVRHHDFLS